MNLDNYRGYFGPIQNTKNKSKLMAMIDSDTSMRFVSRDGLTRRDVSFVAVLDTAIKNLASSTANLWPEALESARQGKVFVFETGDAYDASQILLPDLCERICSAFGCSGIAVAVSFRDILIAVPSDDPKALEHLKVMSSKIFRDSPYGITPELFFSK